MSPPRVYIPNLDGGTHLQEALASLEAQSVAVQVVVVDNGSRDGSAQEAAKRFANVDLLELGRNHGFGRAINAGVRSFPGDPLILLNNDVVCEPHFIESLLDESGDGAAVAAVLLKGSDPSRIDSAGTTADRTLFAFDHLHGEPASAAGSAPPPLGPTGGAALYPLESFEQAGGFDERIFAYLEDLDLGLRMALAGRRCRLAPQARAIHMHSATLGAGSSAKNALMGWSRGYLLGRYRILSRPRLLARALACETVIAGGQIAIDRTASGIPARIRGWRVGRALPPRSLPAGVLDEISAVQALRIRAKRR